MTIYQHPLAYLLGLEGLALLRGWAGEFDESFTRARFDEIRLLLDNPVLAEHPGVVVARGSTEAAYARWAASYDEPNGLFDVDEPFVTEVLDQLAPGTALDAACGTGRMSELLCRRGHQVLGVDSSEPMLAVARRRVPDARFVPGGLDALPADDASVDLVVCSLALSHVESLTRPMTEFARVLRPGGHLVITDVHHELIFRGSVVRSLGPNGEPGLVPTWRHTPVTYLQAALAAGLELLACAEPGRESAPAETPGEAPAETPGAAPVEAPGPARLPTTAEDLGPWEVWPWSLMGVLPAANDAAAWTPYVITWHFRRAAGAAEG